MFGLRSVWSLPGSYPIIADVCSSRQLATDDGLLEPIVDPIGACLGTVSIMVALYDISTLDFQYSIEYLTVNIGILLDPSLE
jgi:hypothetical protein